MGREKNRNRKTSGHLGKAILTAAAMAVALLLLMFRFALPALLSIRTVKEEGHEEIGAAEVRDERYYRMVDEEGSTILVTGRRLRMGDRFLTAENRLYEVVAVKNYLAQARLVEELKLDPQPARAKGGRKELNGVLPAQASPSYTIAIYHTHNAESYVPSDGSDSIYGRGGVHDVGDSFQAALEEKGIKVLHAEQLHLPHDRGAYRRSRSTVQKLAAQRPDAIFDIHRDAAPWDAYAREVNGKWISQLTIVVGRSNPGASLNQAFAYDLKGYADQLYPGLVKGVLMAWGSYNQDLYPLELLLEVGAHTNTKESAQRGIALFADVVAYYFYGPEILDDQPGGAAGREQLPPALYRDAGGIYGAISSTVIGLLLASLAAAVGFYFLNNPGSLEELYRRLGRFPEKARAFGRDVVERLKSSPAYLRYRWRQFPGELRAAWFELREEAVLFPGWLYARVKALSRLLKAAAASAWRSLRAAPGNLVYSYRKGVVDLSRFAGESVERLRNLWERLLALRNRLR